MLLSELLERPIAFNRAYKTITGSTVAALFLSQAVYWQNRTSGWFYKTIEQWEDETGLTRREQETARRVLKRLGVLIEEKRGVPCRLYYKVDLERLIELLQTSKAKSTNPVCQNSVSNLENLHKNGTSHPAFDKLKAKKRQTRKSKSDNPVWQKSPINLQNFAKNDDSHPTFDKQVCTNAPNKPATPACANVSLHETCNPVCTNAPNINLNRDYVTETTFNKKVLSNFFVARERKIEGNGNDGDDKDRMSAGNDDTIDLTTGDEHASEHDGGAGAAESSGTEKSSGTENAQESFIEAELIADSPNIQSRQESVSNEPESPLKSKPKPKRKVKVETEAERAFRQDYYAFAKRAMDWLVARGGVQEDPARYWAWARKLNQTDERVTVEVMKACFNIYAQTQNGTGWRGKAKSFKQFVAAFNEIFQFLNNNQTNTNHAPHQSNSFVSDKLQQEFAKRDEWLNAVNAILAQAQT